MTLNEIGDRICFGLNDPLNHILKENAKFSFKLWRATLIRRDVERNGLSDEFLQKADYDLIKVDKADTCAFDIGCQVLRTKNPVPQPVRLKTDVLFYFVGDAYANPFTQVQQEELKYTLYNKWTSKAIRYNYTNSHIYVYGNTKLKWLRLQAIFSDPTLVNTGCTTETCYSDDKEFPIAYDMAQQIILGMINGDFKIMSPTDEEVDIESEKEKPVK